MARPLSSEKRTAILEAATQVVAASGTSAATAAIAKSAGVAEGTLFTYFSNKDELLNALYLDIKSDLHALMTRSLKPGGELVDRCRGVWDSFIGWGLANPEKAKALKQLAVSDRITEETRRLSSGLSSPMTAMFQECSVMVVQKGLPKTYAGTLMSVMAEITASYIAGEPAKARRHIRAGFDAYWRAIGQ
ncbi:MAG: bacterial regulatory s, tetR family protein [Akkermansiaceae bacterium]|nr:bacterial regulatory s, tetR family protein [Akkermansiaceae bacterium]